MKQHWLQGEIWTSIDSNLRHEPALIPGWDMNQHWLQAETWNSTDSRLRHEPALTPGWDMKQHWLNIRYIKKLFCRAGQNLAAECGSGNEETKRCWKKWHGVWSAKWQLITTMRPFNATPLYCRPLLSLHSEPDYSCLTPAHLIAHLIQLPVKNSGESIKDPDYNAEYCPSDVLFHKCQKH